MYLQNRTQNINHACVCVNWGVSSSRSLNTFFCPSKLACLFLSFSIHFSNFSSGKLLFFFFFFDPCKIFCLFLVYVSLHFFNFSSGKILIFLFIILINSCLQGQNFKKNENFTWIKNNKISYKIKWIKYIIEIQIIKTNLQRLN